MPVSEGPVLFFDGVCNLCSQAVQFVIRHDKRGVIRFASLQSAHGADALKAVGAIAGAAPDSLILQLDGRYYTLSDAAMRVAGLLDGPWKGLAAFRFIPRPIRDGIYRFVARYRYRWFGRSEACMLPAPELKERFLED